MKLIILVQLFAAITEARSAPANTGFAQTALNAAKNLFSRRRGRSKFTSQAHANPIVPQVVESPVNKVIELGTNVAMAVAAGGTLYQAAIEADSSNTVSYSSIRIFNFI